MIDPNELLAFAENWPPDVRAQASEALEAIRNGERRAWYCTTYGRKCNGKPHAGYPYNHARGDQWPPPGTDWRRWFLSGGRGSGKTRTGSEYTCVMSEKVSRIALVAPTGADVRDTMVEGVSGLMMVAAMRGWKLDYEPSKRRITFPSGCIATTFSAEQPARLRGPQHGFAWLDEPAHMPLIEEVWSNLRFGLRLGSRPHVVLTSTPLPTKWVKKVQAHRLTKVVRVSTFDNADNLSDDFLEEVREEYEGTRLGLQELYGRVLEDVIGALWRADWIIREPIEYEKLERIVVAIDPAGTANRRSDETGIVVAGKLGKNYWVLHDSSGKYSPQAWATEALRLYDLYGADAIVAEKNFGGDMVKEVLSRAVGTGKEAPRFIIKTASRAKHVRAEPIVALYERNQVFHTGNLADLEDEMLTWVPGTGDSPNRVDALVWALAELSGKTGEARIRSARNLPKPPPNLSHFAGRYNIPDLSKLRRTS